MDELHSKDIRVFSAALDLKNNSSKNIIEMLNQLQTGSILNGKVVGTTPKGETIFYTAYGRLAIAASQKLSNGDRIVIQLVQNKKTQGSIISINDKFVKNPQLLDLKVTNIFNNNLNSNIHSQDASKISLQEYGHVVKTPNELINGQITYLNLSQIAKNSALYKELVQISELPVKQISFSIKPNLENSGSGLVVNAEVISDEIDGSQLLKTKFGIINIENSNLPIGKKLTLEIVNLNDKKLDVNIARTISEFILNHSRGWSELKNLINKNQQGVILRDHEEMTKLTQDYAKIKELLVPNITHAELINNSSVLPEDLWQTIIVPFFYNNGKVEEQSLKIQRISDHYLRFIFDIELETTGVIQLDGLIKFKEDSKTPVNFDIILRSKQKFGSNFQQNLIEAFSEAKLISGLTGYLSFDQN